MKVYESLENNYGKVARIFGNKFVDDSMEDRLNPRRFYQTNEQLARIVYGEDIAKAIRDKDIKKLTEIYNGLDSLKKSNLSGHLDLDKIGIVLVRPETYGACEQYRKFIKSLGLDIVHERDIYVDMDQYLALYYDGMCFGLSHLDDLVDFPTRTFNYINNKSRLMIVYDRRNMYANVSSTLTSYKGKHGNVTPGTFRGDIGINALLPYVISGDELVPNANVPLDPIGAYRFLVRREIDSDGWHTKVDYPILFYAGQSVHIPDEKEIARDFNTLCTEKDLKHVLKKTKR